MSNLKTLRKKNPTEAQRKKRAIGVRKRVTGSDGRPRISVFRSARHIYVQAIDDASGQTLAAASTLALGARRIPPVSRRGWLRGMAGALALSAILPAGGYGALAYFDRRGKRGAGEHQPASGGAGRP